MIVWLTGGIACGKSTVARTLREYGIKVTDTDALAKAAVEPGTEGYNRVAEVFPEVITTFGSIDRKALGNIVFNDKQKKAQLEGILHPIVEKMLKDELFFNFNRIKYYESIFEIVPADVKLQVTTEFNNQIKQLMTRNDLTFAEAMARINAAPPELPHSNKIIIDNDGSVEDLKKKAIKTHLDILHSYIIRLELDLRDKCK